MSDRPEHGQRGLPGRNYRRVTDPHIHVFASHEDAVEIVETLQRIRGQLSIWALVQIAMIIVLALFGALALWMQDDRLDTQDRAIDALWDVTTGASPQE